LRNGEVLKETEVKILCNKAKDILNNEDNVIRVEAPVTVLQIIIRYAAISMANSLILWNSLK